MLAEKAHYPIRVMARVLEVTTSGYYAWRGRPLIPPRVRTSEGLRHRIRLIHAESRGTYGSPRVQRALRDTGARVGRHRIMRLMRLEHLQGRPRRRFRVTTQADPTAVAAPNHLARRFAVDGPDCVWAGDLTALPTAQGWLYLAVLLDLWSRRVVGWAVRPTLETEVVTTAWHMAVGRRQRTPQLHHSDRGAQYTSDAYQRLLAGHQVVCSMSRRGNCWDNAPVESFFRTLKVELVAEAVWPTRAVAAAAVHDYIERFYNTRRLHSSLHYRSPADFEAAHRAAHHSKPPSRPSQKPEGPRRRLLNGAMLSHTRPQKQIKISRPRTKDRPKTRDRPKNQRRRTKDWLDALLLEVRCGSLVFLADELDQLVVRHQSLIELHRPRFGVSLGIVDGHFDFERAVIDAPESFDHLSCVGQRTSVDVEPTAVAKAARLDDQCVAFPTARRIAEPPRLSITRR